MVQRFGDEPMPPHMLVAAGALAGLAASTATFPLEVRALLRNLHAGPMLNRAVSSMAAPSVMSDDWHDADVAAERSCVPDRWCAAA